MTPPQPGTPWFRLPQPEAGVVGLAPPPPVIPDQVYSPAFPDYQLLCAVDTTNGAFSPDAVTALQGIISGMKSTMTNLTTPQQDHYIPAYINSDPVSIIGTINDFFS